MKIPLKTIFTAVICGFVLLVGAPSVSAQTPTEVAKLLASDGAAGDIFGFSVAVNGDTTVIGAFGKSDAGNESGSAYVFSLSDTIQVDIDIKPYNKRNNINPHSKREIWVAILSDEQFDPLQTKIRTVRFGSDGAKVIRHRVRDLNRDGVADLLLRFKIRETGIECGDTRARLRGRTYLGERIRGFDSIETVGCKNK